MTKTNPRHNAATNNHKARPPPLPPKAPFAATSAPRSLQEHLQMTKPKPAAQRGQSASSIVSAASDSSRDCLRREMNRRRQSLTTSEYNFLQDIAANGTEIEVTLAEKRLQDPSLGFDVTEEPEEEGALKHENEEPPLKIVETIPPRLQDDIPSMDFSIETAADRPPDNPMPRSPLPDQKKRTKIPSAAELYPDNELDYSNQDQNIQPRINPVEDLEQTPLVCNFSSKPQKSLEGALELPVVTQQTMLKDTSNSNYNINSNINNSSNNSVASLPQQTMPSLPQQLQLNRASSYSNPNLMGQLWRAHEKGLALTPQQSSKRILLRREQSLSALSPVRRRAMARRNSSTVSSGKKSLLNSKELMANKQRNHARSSSELPWAQMVGNATTALAVLRNTSTDSSTEDMSSLLLPTDEEIFRRSQQLQKQQDNKQQHSSGQPKLPPPRPFREPHSKEQKDTTPYQQEASKPAALRRMASEGATASTAPQIQRKPSILRRMISDGVTSSQNKSVSFQIDHSIKENGTTTPLYHRADSLPTVPSDLGDSISTFTSEHTHTVSDVLREREESCSSIPSIRHGTPLKEDSSKQSQLPKQFAMHRQQQGTPDSNNTEETAATSSATSKNIWSRRDSTSSVASLNLHRANPIRQDSIASTAEGWQANEEFQSELMYSRRESMSSIASLDLHIAAPIRQESIGSTIVGAEQQQVPDDASAAFRRRDSMTSIASIRKASPVRQESIASNADGMEATEAFRQQFLSSPSTVQATWGRRDSMDSIASLNLHLARPIINRQESIGSTAEGLDAAEAFRQKIASERWGRRDSVTSLISRQESLLSINDSINLNFDDLDTSEAFRERGWARRDSMSSLATLNLHQATPIRQDSVASSTWRRQESMGSVASLNIHKAQPIRSDTMSVDIEILRNQGSAIPEKDSNDSEDDDEATPLAAIQPAKPIRQESIHSTVSGKEAKESLKSQFADKQESLREASTGTTMSSTSEALLPLRQDSCASIPSLRPAHPLRQDSVASTTAGEEAKEELCKQFQRATVCEEWEGTVLPESWEDKKEEDGTFPGYDKNFVKGPVVLSRKNVSRPVMMRHASASEYDEEGMEVAAIEEEDEEPSEEEHSTGEDDAVDKAQLLVLPHHTPNTSEDTAIHKNGNRHFPNSLVSFGVNSSSKSQSSAIDACASFDESKIVDRYRGVFRGELPRSLSEDELPLLLSSHCSK